jgi:predicted nucleic acid-binding protein
MRIVVDTNVFVSAALKDTSMPALAVRMIEQRSVPIVTPAIFVEGAMR